MFRRTRARNEIRMPVLAAALATVGVLWAAPAAAESELRISEPKARTIVLGPSRIAVTADLDPGVKIVRVTFSVDDATVGVRESPPWAMDVDFGPNGRDAKLRADATLSDGSVVRAYGSTRALVINEIATVDLVNLYILAQRNDGNYDGSLQESDFRVLEDGVPQHIERFSTERKPLTVAIVIDVSQSMKKGDRLGQAQRAASSFLSTLEKDDQVLFVTFSDEVRLEGELTDDLGAIAERIRATEPHRGTALYDGIFRGAKALEQIPGRKVMVLLTDGRDEAYSGLEPGSFHTLDESIEKALRNDVMIFAIGLGREVRRAKDFYEREYLVDILERIAHRTGGRLLLPERAGLLRKAFEGVEEDLRSQYSIAYQSTNRNQDGKWREIQVETSADDLQVITRRGYFAPLKMADDPTGAPVAPVPQNGGGTGHASGSSDDAP